MVLRGPAPPQLPPEQHQQLLETCRPEFLEALQAIPNSEKRAYLHALEEAPTLLQTETPIDRFLVCDAYNVQDAANRFVAYWEMRRNLFGDRAFKPLRTEQNGALDENDVSMLLGGQAYVLPNDKEGRFVMVMESNFPSPPVVPNVAQCRLRTLFYLLHIASTQSSTQQLGLVGLYVLNKPVLDDRTIAFGLEVLGDALPIRLHCLHAICPDGPGHVDNFFERVLPCVTRVAGDFHGHQGRCYAIHICKPPAELGYELIRTHGLAPLLPTCLGGSFSKADASRWFDAQIAVENNNKTGSSHPSSPTVFPDRASTTTTSLTRQERESKNSIRYSRNKRVKQRAAQEALDIQARYLTVENQRARTEQARLGTLLLKAQTLLTTLGMAVPPHHPHDANLVLQCVNAAASNDATVPLDESSRQMYPIEESEVLARATDTTDWETTDDTQTDAEATEPAAGDVLGTRAAAMTSVGQQQGMLQSLSTLERDAVGALFHGLQHATTLPSAELSPPFLQSNLVGAAALQGMLRDGANSDNTTAMHGQRRNDRGDDQAMTGQRRDESISVFSLEMLRDSSLGGRVDAASRTVAPHATNGERPSDDTAAELLRRQMAGQSNNHDTTSDCSTHRFPQEALGNPDAAAAAAVAEFVERLQQGSTAVHTSPLALQSRHSYSAVVDLLLEILQQEASVAHSARQIYLEASHRSTVMAQLLIACLSSDSPLPDLTPTRPVPPPPSLLHIEGTIATNPFPSPLSPTMVQCGILSPQVLSALSAALADSAASRGQDDASASASPSQRRRR